MRRISTLQDDAEPAALTARVDELLLLRVSSTDEATTCTCDRYLCSLHHLELERDDTMCATSRDTGEKMKRV